MSPAIAPAAPAAPAAPKAKKTKAPVAPEALQLIKPEEYLLKLQGIRTTMLKPAFLEKLIPPSYQRGIIERQVKRIEAALRNGEYVPDIILAEKPDPVGGKPKYAVVDGLQRATAARNCGFPLRATIIDFGSDLRERQHFVAFQRTHKVNANIICEVFGDNQINAAIKRISELEGHPFKDKIWYGRGLQTQDSIQAINLVSAVSKKGVPVEDLEQFTRLIGTIWPVDRTATQYKSGGVYGMIAFFLGVDADFDSRIVAHVEHMRKFDWTTQTIVDASRINTKKAGAVIGGALLAHWSTFKA